jgi:hypothetical protein
MVDHASIAPGPARLQRARRAGLRPRARGLAPALGLLVLAAWLEADHPGLARSAARLEAALRAPSGHALAAIGTLALELAAWMLLTALACAWIAAVVSGEAGSVARDAGLDGVRWRRTLLGPLLLALAGLAWLAAATHGLVAGAARAADAGEDALVTLWREWAVRGALALATALAVAALVERWLDRRALFRALYLTVAGARAERRESGGRRG